MWPDPPVDWSTMTVAELRAELMARKLNSKGLKDELIERLRAWDASLEQEAAQHAHAEAAAAEAAAAEGVSPSATNNAQLHAAQELFAGMKDMQVCVWAGAERDSSSRSRGKGWRALPAAVPSPRQLPHPFLPCPHPCRSSSCAASWRCVGSRCRASGRP